MTTIAFKALKAGGISPYVGFPLAPTDERPARRVGPRRRSDRTVRQRDPCLPDL